MVEPTTACGRGATHARSGRFFDRLFVRALVIAVVLHAPLIPSRLFDWARVALFHQLDDYDDKDASTIVPIDLDLLTKDPVAEAPPPAPSSPPPAEPSPGPGDTVVDAGAPRPKREPLDAGAPRDAGEERATVDAGPPAPAPLKDPTSLAGGAGKISAKDPNVQLLLSGRAMRKHALGGFFSRLLLKIPEWKQFFQGTPIDPIEDLDHLLITAPRLKGDSGKMVAIMGLRADAERIRDAVDQVVHRTNGVWLEDAPVTAARAKVAGAPRIFALLPQKKLLVVLPGDAEDQLAKLKQAKAFRNSSEGLVVSLLTPSRPFRDFISLPDTLKWIRIALTPTPDGGVDIAIDAGDANAGEAERHAEQMTRELERRRKVDLGLVTIEVFDAVKFETSGETIRARTHVTKQKLGQIMAFVEQQAEARLPPPPAPK